MLEIKSWLGDLLFASFFVIPIISTGVISFAGRVIGNIYWKASKIVDICSIGVEMRCGLKIPDSFSVRISAFSLSKKASELSGRRRGGWEILILSIDFVTRQRDPFEKEWVCMWFLYTLVLWILSSDFSLLERESYFILSAEYWVCCHLDWVFVNRVDSG